MSVVDITPLEDESLVERRMRVLTMRNAGATFTQIADRVNAGRAELGQPLLSVTTIRKDHAKALVDVVAASREELIAEHRSVLLDMRRAHYGAALNGDIDSTRLVLSTLEREARLFGLDAPTQVSLGVSDIDFSERMFTAITELGLEPPKEIADAVRHARDDADALRPANPETPSSARKGERNRTANKSDDVLDVLDVEEVDQPDASTGWSNID